MDVDESYLDWFLFSLYQLIVLLAVVAISFAWFIIKTYNPQKPRSAAPAAAAVPSEVKVDDDDA